MTRVFAATSPDNHTIQRLAHLWDRYENTVLWHSPNHNAETFIQELLDTVLLHRHSLDPQLLHTMLEKAAVIQDDLCSQMPAPGKYMRLRVNLHTLVTTCPNGPLAYVLI